MLSKISQTQVLYNHIHTNMNFRHRIFQLDSNSCMSMARNRQWGGMQHNSLLLTGPNSNRSVNYISQFIPLIIYIIHDNFSEKFWQ